MPNDYVNLKNLQGVEIKPITDLAAINLTEVNGIAVEGNTIGIQDGYIESAYYTEMVDPTVGPAASSSAYVEGGTIYTLLGGYAVTSAINTASPSQQKVPSEAAVVSAFDDIVVSGASYYAGIGINIDAGHTVSVANVPTSAVAGLDTQLTGISASVAGKQDAISAGYRMELSGTTLSQARYFPIESPTSATITLQAGHAYKIQATAGSKTLTAETIPANQFGLEGHAEIFIANTGLIKTTSSVVLANALEPDAVNNCTVRFHDGLAIISVEDHVAGYIVVSATGSTAGTLPYALGSASQEYVAFDAALNGQTLDMGGATTNGEKHVVGNGYTETIISGGINCTSKTTFANLGMNGVVVSSGTMTLGDVYIPAGANVAVSGGGLVIEKVSGNGGTIELGGTMQTVYGTRVYVNGTTVTGGCSPNSDTNGGAFLVDGLGVLDLNGCSFVGNSSLRNGGAFCANAAGTINVTSCYIADNHTPYNHAIYCAGIVNLSGSTITEGQDIYAYATGSATFGGSNHLLAQVRGGTVSVAISSGAIVDLTGNTNATPIAPGGGITFEEGGATVYPSAGQASAYMLGGMTVPTIGNTNVVNLSNSHVEVISGSVYASGCVFLGGSGTYGGALKLDKARTELFDCTFSSNTAYYGGGGLRINSGTCFLSSCTFTSNSGPAQTGAIEIVGTGAVEIVDCSFGQDQVIKVGDSNASCSLAGNDNTVYAILGSGHVTISSGAVLDLTGNANTAPIYPGGGITLYGGVLNQPTTIIYSSGGNVGSRTFEDLEIQGATITKLGLVYGATVYSLAGDDHEIIYTEDNGATSSSVFISGETVYVVPGALMKVANT